MLAKTNVFDCLFLLSIALFLQQPSCQSADPAPPANTPQVVQTAKPNPPAEPTIELRFHLADESPSDEFNTPISLNHQNVHMDPEPVITQNDIANAEAMTGNGRRAAVAVEFTEDAAQHLVNVTGGNIGRFLVIMIDGEVVSIPRIASTIERRAHITGHFTDEQARRWASQINNAASQ